MAVSDPIADFLTRIRNAIKAQHRYVDIGWSRMNQRLADILKAQGFIENYILKMDGPSRGTVRLFLKYSQGRRAVIQGLRRISKPGLRKYVACEEIPNFYGNMGLSILSTSQGVLAGSEASERKIGGELLCLIW